MSVFAQPEQADWPSQNLNIQNSRFSPLDQINATNEGTKGTEVTKGTE